MKKLLIYFIIVFMSSSILAKINFISRNNIPDEMAHPQFEYYAKYKNKKVFIYNKKTDELLLEFKNNDFVTCVALSYDMKYIAVGDYTKLTLSKLFTNKLTNELAIEKSAKIVEREPIDCIAFHPKRQTFSYCSGFYVKVCNYLESNIGEIARIHPNKKIEKLYFSSDGNQIIAEHRGIKEIADITVLNKKMGKMNNSFGNLKFKIIDFTVIDDNKNNKIEAGELIDVKIDFQNEGLGDAYDIVVEFKENKKREYLLKPKYAKMQKFNEIKKGESVSALVQILVSDFAKNEIRLAFDIRLSAGKPSDLFNYEIPIKINDPFIISSEKDNKQIVIEKTNTETNHFVDVDENIPKTNIDGKNTLAIIIGIEDYKYAPTVDFASNDARVFYQYSKSVFGIPGKNIYYRINNGATLGEFNKIFTEDGWIARRLKKEQTDVIVYYSGHGAPDTKSEKGYLIPYDIDPNYASTGVSLDFIYSSLSKLQAKSVTLFIDACFSGESRSQEMLIAGIRPISIKIKNPVLTTNNMAVFSASTGEQYSSAYPEKQHGLFTYFLLKGLKGAAKGSDNNITLEKLQNYIKKNVEETAGYLDKEQNPTFIGKDKYRVLLKY